MARAAGLTGRVRVVVELAAADDREPLVEQADEQPGHPRLGLAALAEEDDVVAGEDRVLDRRQDRLLVADDGRQDLGAGGEAVEQVRSQLLLDRPRAPAGGAQLGDGGGALGRSACGTSVGDGRRGGGVAVRSVAVDGGAHGVDIDDAGLGEAGEVVAPAIDLELEVAGLATDAERELGRDAPAEVLESVAARVPGREDGRAQALDVAVLVARRRADVVGGDDAAQAVADAAQDEDDARAATARRRRASTGGRRSVSKTSSSVVGVDRRGQAVADARGPDRDARLGAPGVGRQVVGQLRDEQDGVVGTDRRTVGGAPGRPGRGRQPELRRLRQPVERLRRPLQLDDPRCPAAGSRGARSSSVVLPAAAPPRPRR